MMVRLWALFLGPFLTVQQKFLVIVLSIFYLARILQFLKATGLANPCCAEVVLKGQEGAQTGARFSV